MMNLISCLIIGHHRDLPERASEHTERYILDIQRLNLNATEEVNRNHRTVLVTLLPYITLVIGSANILCR